MGSRCLDARGRARGDGRVGPNRPAAGIGTVCVARVRAVGVRSLLRVCLDMHRCRRIALGRIVVPREYEVNPPSVSVSCTFGLSVSRQHPFISAMHMKYLLLTVTFGRRLVGNFRVLPGTWRWMQRTPCAPTVLRQSRQLRTRRRSRKGAAPTLAFRLPVYQLPRRRGRRLAGAAAE